MKAGLSDTMNLRFTSVGKCKMKQSSKGFVYRISRADNQDNTK